MIQIPKYNLLLIDDEENVRFVTAENIRNNLKRVNIDEADSIGTATKLIKEKNYHLIVTDFYMKDGTGLDILYLIKQVHPKTPVVVISGGSKEERKIVLQQGAAGFLTKPMDFVELSYMVGNLLKLYEASECLESAENIIIALTRAVDAKDAYTEGHSQRVAYYSVLLYDELGFDDEEDRNNLYTGCILHDIGKIAIPDNILNSSTHPLSNEQFEIIKTHTIRGHEICMSIKNLGRALEIIRSHHEKLDGSGYPDGLKKGEISNIVQIATIADIYDALTTRRSYRNANDKNFAFEIMEEEAKAGKINDEYFRAFKMIV